MTLVSTTLTLPDNQSMVIPNNSIWGGIITNITGVETRRVGMIFGISYRQLRLSALSEYCRLLDGLLGLIVDIVW